MAHLRQALALLGLGLAIGTPSDLYVDCQNGSDNSGTGSPSSPWKTLAYAASYLRGQTLSSDVTVHVLPGVCVNTNFSEPLLTLGVADSGNPSARIVWQADGPAPTVLSGGAQLNASRWVLVNAAMNMYAYNLTADGLTQFGLGSITSGGLGQCTNQKAELFFGGAPMLLARYPNLSPTGEWQWINIRNVTGATSFITADPRPATWAKEAHAWVHGYWQFDWADNYVHVLSVSSAPGGGSIINTDPATPVLYGLLPHARFMGVNLLSELDVPTEYYIDDAAGMLYFIPPAPLSSADAFLSMSQNVIIASGSSSTEDVDVSRLTPRVLESPSALPPADGRAVAPVTEYPAAGASGSNFQFVTFRGFTVMYSRGVGVSIGDAFAVVLDSLDMSNHGGSALSLSGYNSAVINATVTGTGCYGAYVGGGDEPSLTSGNLLVTQSTFSNYARFCRTYQPGVSWSGVGNTYANNTITDAPHNGFFGGGNNNVFMGNYLHRLCYEVSDSGAWYAGRSWVRRGNLIMNNTFSVINNTEGYTLGYPSVQAVYLDDELSQVYIVNNTFVDCFKGAFVGGGRDNYVAGNTFIRNGYATHLDNRGMNWQADSCTYNASWTGDLVEGLFSVNYTLPPYSTSYPPIVSTLSNHPCVPVNNSIVYNTYCALQSGFIDISGNASDWYSTVADNVEFTNC